MMPVEALKKTKARRTLSVPLTPEQIADLARRAGKRPLSAFVREHLFPANDNTRPKPARPRRAELAAFAAKVLALLGPVSTTLKSIAHAMASGVLPFAPDTEAAVLKACADIAEIKSLLMKALGVRER
jgi:hypothetical protein